MWSRPSGGVFCPKRCSIIYIQCKNIKKNLVYSEFLLYLCSRKNQYWAGCTALTRGLDHSRSCSCLLSLRQLCIKGCICPSKESNIQRTAVALKREFWCIYPSKESNIQRRYVTRFAFNVCLYSTKETNLIICCLLAAVFFMFHL